MHLQLGFAVQVFLKNWVPHSQLLFIQLALVGRSTDSIDDRLDDHCGQHSNEGRSAQSGLAVLLYPVKQGLVAFPKKYLNKFPSSTQYNCTEEKKKRKSTPANALLIN